MSSGELACNTSQLKFIFTAQAAMESAVSGSSRSRDFLIGRLRTPASLMDLSQTRQAEAILVAKNKSPALKNDQYEISAGVGGNARHSPNAFPPFHAMTINTHAIPNQ